MIESELGQGVVPHTHVLKLDTVLARQASVLHQRLQDWADEFSAHVGAALEYVIRQLSGTISCAR